MNTENKITVPLEEGMSAIYDEQDSAVLPDDEADETLEIDVDYV